MTKTNDRGLIWCSSKSKVSGLDWNFWVEESKYDMKESNKLSFR